MHAQQPSEPFMRRALALAEQARGRTSPNPMVGAVLVKDGRIVGEGYHRRAGEPHAEIEALRAAGEDARGATLYVTLEPCCHYGRTPPCTNALIAAGVAEVHMAMLDPNPRVAGKGRAALEAAGIRTTVGLCEDEARALNAAFIKWVTTGRPLVIAKFAMSLDGKIAAHTGDARWISGETSRIYAHHLRNEVDAILVGVQTVLADNPRLTTRLPSATDVRHPVRIVLDSRGRAPLDAEVFQPTLPGRTLVATTSAMPASHRAALEAQGVDVLVCPSVHGRVALPALLDELGKREITSLLVEGGGTVLGSFFDAGLVDEVVAFVAPMVIGGEHAPQPVGGHGVARVADAWRLDDLRVERLGDDILVRGRVRHPHAENE